MTGTVDVLIITALRAELDALLKVARGQLEPWVKVEKNWSRNFFLLRQLGYQ